MITRTVFNLQTNSMTALTTVMVMDREEFNELVDAIPTNLFDVGKQARGVNAARLKEVGHLPLMMRGSLTEPIFQKYEISTPYLSAIVRGVGELLMAAMAGEKV